jgi:hypothetical protein
MSDDMRHEPKAHRQTGLEIASYRNTEFMDEIYKQELVTRRKTYRGLDLDSLGPKNGATNDDRSQDFPAVWVNCGIGYW